MNSYHCVKRVQWKTCQAYLPGPTVCANCPHLPSQVLQTGTINATLASLRYHVSCNTNVAQLTCIATSATCLYYKVTCLYYTVTCFSAAQQNETCHTLHFSGSYVITHVLFGYIDKLACPENRIRALTFLFGHRN